MSCQFCNAAAPFTQHEMRYHIFDLTAIESRWRLCRDCAEIRTDGTQFNGYGTRDKRGGCVDCDDDAAYGIALLKETPAGNIAPGDDVYDVLCADHFEERST